MAAVKTKNGFNRLPLRALDKPLKRVPWSLAARFTGLKPRWEWEVGLSWPYTLLKMNQYRRFPCGKPRAFRSVHLGIWGFASAA